MFSIYHIGSNKSDMGIFEGPLEKHITNCSGISISQGPHWIFRGPRPWAPSLSEPWTSHRIPWKVIPYPCHILRQIRLATLYNQLTQKRTAGHLTPVRHSLHHRLGHTNVQFATCKVVQEVQSLGTMTHDVIDTHRHQVDAHSVVTTTRLSNLGGNVKINIYSSGAEVGTIP